MQPDLSVLPPLVWGSLNLSHGSNLSFLLNSAGQLLTPCVGEEDVCLEGTDSVRHPDPPVSTLSNRISLPAWTWVGQQAPAFLSTPALASGAGATGKTCPASCAAAWDLPSGPQTPQDHALQAWSLLPTPHPR